MLTPKMFICQDLLRDVRTSGIYAAMRYECDIVAAILALRALAARNINVQIGLIPLKKLLCFAPVLLLSD